MLIYGKLAKPVVSFSATYLTNIISKTVKTVKTVKYKKI